MNFIGTKVKANPLKESLMDEGLAIPRQKNPKATGKDLLSNDDNC